MRCAGRCSETGGNHGSASFKCSYTDLEGVGEPDLGKGMWTSWSRDGSRGCFVTRRHRVRKKGALGKKTKVAYNAPNGVNAVGEVLIDRVEVSTYEG